jgi:hypothetical protein
MSRVARRKGLLCILVAAWLCLLPVSLAAQANTCTTDEVQKAAGNLRDRVQKFLRDFDTLDLNPASQPVRDKLKLYRDAAADFQNCAGGVQKTGVDRLATRRTFSARHDGKLREDLFRVAIDDLASCRVNRLTLAESARGSRETDCCQNTEIKERDLSAAERPLAEPIFQLGAEIPGLWSPLTDKCGPETLASTKAVLARFERKLIDGFPAMPWEYIWNLHGNRDGPTPHQIIWLHPNMAAEVKTTGAINDGENRFQPVFVVQTLGYNRYFLKAEKGPLRRLNYIGLAGVVTFNTTEGRRVARPGGIFHFGNFLSVGATRGDGRWQLYVSSDKVFDQVLRFLH